MDTTLIILSIVLTLIGIAGAIVPGIPGPIVSWCALLCSFLCDGSQLTTTTIVAWAILTIAATVSDLLLPAVLAKQFGGSKASAWGAIVGLFAGIIFTPIGMLMGSFLGAVAGELLHDSSDKGRALKAGFGSFLAFILGTGLKLMVSIWMAWLVAKDLWTMF